MNEAEVAERVFGLRDGEGNAKWWGGGLATIRATGKETDDLYSIVEVLEPEGARAPLHLHRKEDEAFYVLEGEMTFQIGEQTIRARPGSFVFGPKDVPHTYAVGSGPAKLLFLLSPPGFEGFVEAVSEPAEAPPCRHPRRMVHRTRTTRPSRRASRFSRPVTGARLSTRHRFGSQARVRERRSR
jgi:quercetin dioxygenase-like cupin family protein